jgi:hypothetical protein
MSMKPKPKFDLNEIWLEAMKRCKKIQINKKRKWSAFEQEVMAVINSDLLVLDPSQTNTGAKLKYELIKSASTFKNIGSAPIVNVKINDDDPNKIDIFWAIEDKD